MRLEIDISRCKLTFDNLVPRREQVIECVVWERSLICKKMGMEEEAGKWNYIIKIERYKWVDGSRTRGI